MTSLLVDRKLFDRNVAFLLKSHAVVRERIFDTTLLTLSHDDNSDPEYTVYLYRGKIEFYDRLWLSDPAYVRPM